MKEKILLIASSGGHLSEILLNKELFKKYDCLVVTEKDKITKSLTDKYNIKFLLKGTRSTPLRYPFICIINFFKSLYIFFKFKPELIYTTGAHTCVPMCYIAHFFKSKIIFIEVFDRINNPTLTSKLIYKIADTFIVQHEEMLEIYPKAKCIGGIY